MSASESIHHKQFYEVFRGFSGVSPETLDKGSLGRHWTTNKRVAESFANDTADPDEPTTIVSALVRGKHIIPTGTEEWHNEAGLYGAEEDSVESEMTVRPGARVHVTGITHYPNATDSERYTPRSAMSFGELRKFRA
jgi:hypothetical protein